MDSNRGEFPLDHGSIFFKMHRADEDAEFIRCRSKVDKKKLVNHALTTWNLPSSPGVMLRICGTLVSSARSRSSEANDDFVTTLEGVLKAADTAGAWMFSTGLDFGMAAAVGMTLGRSRHNCACPLIGFTEWDVVQGKDQIQRGIGGKPPEKGSKRIYTDCQPNDDMSTCSLQANHTHYVLVGGKGDEDYSAPDPNKSKAQQLLEARKRSFTFAHDFDRTMSLSDGVKNRKADERIPRILMVICGDETTLAEVLTYCKQGDGVVVFASATGGLAQAITQYVYTDEVPSEWQPFAAQFKELRAINAAKHTEMEAERKAKQKGVDKATESALLPGSHGQFPLFVFNLKKGAVEACSTILDAIMLQITTPRAKVLAAVKWDDGERLSQIFTAMVPAWLVDRADILREATQFALEEERSECIKVLVDLAAPVKELDLLTLYNKLYDKEMPPRYPMFLGFPLPTLGRDTRKTIEEAKRESLSKDQTAKQRMMEKSKSTPSWASGLGVEKSYAQLVEEDAEEAMMHDIYNFYPKEVWETLQEVVPGLCAYWRDEVKKQNEPLPADADAADVANAKVGARWIDIYVWAVLLGNAELATMLLPACQEPMRAAVIGAKIFAFMADRLPLNAVELHKSSATQEDWAVDLLTQCDNFTDARRMLITKSSQWQRTVLHLAVQSGLRNFCAHHHCQTLCDEWGRGNDDFDGTTAVLMSRASPGPAMMVKFISFAAFPIRSFWGRRMEWSAGPPNGDKTILPPVTEFYRIPMVKSTLRLFFHLLYTSFMSYAAMETIGSKQPPGDPYIGHQTVDFHAGGGWEKWQIELVGFLWTLSLVLDEWYKYIQQPDTFQADFWNSYDYFTLTLTSSALFLRFVSIDFAVELFAFCILLIWCRIFKYLGSNQSIGLLVIMIMNMFNDIVLWALVSGIFIASYSVAFVTITNPDAIDQETTTDHPLTVPLWAMMGAFDHQAMHAWNPNVGQPLLWSYLVVSNIVLVNLLIAMMGDTYSTIKEKADEEWKFGRLRSVVEANERMHPVPPPLNLPITFSYFVFCKLGSPGFLKFLDLKMVPKPDTLTIVEAGKRKRKVARQLLLSRKATQEKDEAASVVGRLQQMSKDMEDLEHALAEVVLKANKTN